MRDSFVFYKSFADACRELDPDTFKVTVLAMCDYAMEDKDPDINGVPKAIFIMAKPNIDSNNQRYANGKKGGRPSNQSETESKPNDNQTETKVKPNDNQTETEVEPNEDVDEDVEVKRKTNKREAPIEVCQEIVATLNAATGCNYKASSSKTRTLINARLNEGYTVADFKIVIAKKAEEWMGTEREKYLRPETLFGTKFESYLNQPTEKHEENPRSGTIQKVNDFNKFEQRDCSDDDYLTIERAIAIDW